MISGCLQVTNVDTGAYDTMGGYILATITILIDFERSFEFTWTPISIYRENRFIHLRAFGDEVIQTQQSSLGPEVT